jgi:hypothetical protein
MNHPNVILPQKKRGASTGAGTRDLVEDPGESVATWGGGHSGATVGFEVFSSF